MREVLRTAAFINRYGPGAQVGVKKLVDPDRGLGYPAGFRGSLFDNEPPLSRRDIALAALAQPARRSGAAIKLRTGLGGSWPTGLARVVAGIDSATREHQRTVAAYRTAIRSAGDSPPADTGQA